MIRGLQSNLRAVERSDSRFVRDLLDDPVVGDGWGTAGVPLSVHLVENDIEEWIANEIETWRPTCLIIENLEGIAIGLVLVDVSGRPNQSMATLSIAITAGSRNQGTGSDAMVALLDALFNEWGIHRVQVHCESGNDRAIALYRALGFRQEAVKVRATFTNGDWGDQIVFALLSTDPRPDRTA